MSLTYAKLESPADQGMKLSSELRYKVWLSARSYERSPFWARAKASFRI